MSFARLQTIDLFGIPVIMNFFGQPKSKTILGGICSLIFFSFVGWSIYNGAQNLLSRIDPKIINYDTYVQDPREVVISRDSFPIAINIQGPAATNYVPFMDESIYQVQVNHYRLDRTKLENGTVDLQWTIKNIKIEKCQPDYFSGSSYSTMSLSASYCISDDQPELEEISIQGVFSSMVYQTIIVQILECDNATSTIPCASQEKIDEYLVGGWFNAMYLNTIVNPQDYSQPNSRYRDIYATMISPSDYKESEVRLGYVEFATDSGWLLENIHSREFLKVDEIVEYFQTQPNPEKVLIQCSFLMSNLETYYSRSYTKIQTVLAEVGGLANSAFWIFVVALAPYLRLKFREALVNELFDIKMTPKASKQKGRKLKRISTKDSIPLETNNEKTETDHNQKGNHKTAQKKPTKSKLKLRLETYQDNIPFETLNTVRSMSPHDALKFDPALTERGCIIRKDQEKYKTEDFNNSSFQNDPLFGKSSFLKPSRQTSKESLPQKGLIITKPFDLHDLHEAKEDVEESPQNAKRQQKPEECADIKTTHTNGSNPQLLLTAPTLLEQKLLMPLQSTESIGPFLFKDNATKPDTKLLENDQSPHPSDDSFGTPTAPNELVVSQSRECADSMIVQIVFFF